MTNDELLRTPSAQAAWREHELTQLRYFRSLPLRDKLRAVEGMSDVVRQIQRVRARGGFKSATSFAKHQSTRAWPEVREPMAHYGPNERRHDIPLEGCTPEPLMNYLKGLGVLRLVCEQKDSAARGYWHGDVFHLVSVLDREALCEFFLRSYTPTPIFSPWNGDGGFLTETGASVETIEALRSHASPRFGKIRSAIAAISEMPIMQNFAQARQKRKELEATLNVKYRTKAEKWKKQTNDAEKLIHSDLVKREKTFKQEVVSSLRAEFPDESLPWMDACLLLENDTFAAAPLLGSGGVDGRMEFSANFYGNVLKVIENGDTSASWLSASLLQRQARVVETSIGQFAPGRIGGPNATQGLKGSSLLNPWDYVLMIEGVVLFAGTIGRKLGVNQMARAAFPFTVVASSAGDESLVQKECGDARGEIWLPLWSRPAGLSEIRQLLADGRGEWAGRLCATGVDFARAASDLGVDRGIDEFSRQGLLKRNGLAFIATPLGRVDVRVRERAHLLREVDAWLVRFRAACGGKTSARVASPLRRIDSAVFDYCRYGGASHFQGIIIALGRAERELMRDGAWAIRNKVRPLAGLSSDWIGAANDGSAEFEFALALASIYGSGKKIGALRTNLEPVVLGKSGDTTFANWAKEERAVVWTGADFPTNLAAVLARRIMDGVREGCARLPIDGTRNAALETVSEFIAGRVDDAKMDALLWGLMLIDLTNVSGVTRHQRMPEAPPLPRAYALLKLLFLPRPLTAAMINGRSRWRYAKHEERGILIRPESRIYSLLRAGRVGDACDIAVRRLRASGITPTAGANAWNGLNDSLFGVRIAAALLAPVDSRSVDHLVHLLVRGDEIPDLEPFNSEEEIA